MRRGWDELRGWRWRMARGKQGREGERGACVYLYPQSPSSSPPNPDRLILKLDFLFFSSLTHIDWKPPSSSRAVPRTTPSSSSSPPPPPLHPPPPPPRLSPPTSSSASVTQTTLQGSSKSTSLSIGSLISLAVLPPHLTRQDLSIGGPSTLKRPRKKSKMLI
jgi:hypothetical protein